MNASWVLLDRMVEQKSPLLKKYIDRKLRVPAPQGPFVADTFNRMSLFEKMDSSHFETFLPSSNKKDVLTFKTLLKNSEPSFLKSFLLNTAEQALYSNYALLPYAYLEDFQSSDILELSAAKLQRLILLLAMYDLKFTLKVIIDQKMLAKIFKFLPPECKQFLDFLQTEKDRIEFKKIPLDTWDEKSETLLSLLYLRGLNRLAKAFPLEPEYIKNEIILRLPLKDKGHFKTLATPLDTSLIDVLRDQITRGIEFLNRASNSS